MNKADYEKNIKNGILERQLNSWDEFAEFVADSNRCSPTCIFRGQANSEWLVESTLNRMEKRFPKTPNSSGGEEFDYPCVSRKLQLDRFKEMARGKLTNPPRDDEEDEWWALAQHHGLATPVLDCTYSPFVALFFAFEDEKCWCKEKKDKEDKDVYKKPEFRAVFALLHHIVRDQKTEDKLAPRPFSPKGHANYRLVNQGGVLLNMPEPEYKDESGKRHIIERHIDLETYVRKNFLGDTWKEPEESGQGRTHPRAILQKLIIPNKGRVECLKFLDHMNINRSSLFPDLDGAARYVNALWEVNFDKAIGQIN